MRICFTLASALVLSACSMQGAVDKMASADEKAFALNFANAICQGSLETYKDRFAPELWSKTTQLLPQAKPYCPAGKAKSRLRGYHFETNAQSDGVAKKVRMVVVSESPGKWTITTIETLATSGEPKIIGWNIDASNQKPEDIVAIDSWDSNVIYLQIGIPLLFLLMVGSVVWFYQRSKAKS